jgi:predicted enzyme related to lactoylglutathione lyase
MMSSSHGIFCWYELMTSDTKAAEAFYRGVLGWSMKDAGVPDRSYTILSVGETPIGGLMTLPEEARAMGARPGWNGYIAVDDVDDYAARVKQAGGAIHHGPEDIPGIARFAVVADPQGAMFQLIKGFSDDAPQWPGPSTPGFPGWRELFAGDWEPAFAFYSGLFGWTKAEAFDMGPMGTYQLFAIKGVPSGGMMTKPKQMPRPSWLFYFNVDSIDAASARVTAGGGRILLDPTEVPGGSWIVQCADPQSAMFALVGPRSAKA